MKYKQHKHRLQYEAVSIHPSIMGACPAVHQVVDKRFLASEAPHLPLPECSNPTGCRCKYQHWYDRREEDRRSPVQSASRQYLAAEERRSEKDRRSS